MVTVQVRSWHARLGGSSSLRKSRVCFGGSTDAVGVSAAGVAGEECARVQGDDGEKTTEALRPALGAVTAAPGTGHRLADADGPDGPPAPDAAGGHATRAITESAHPEAHMGIVPSRRPRIAG